MNNKYFIACIAILFITTGAFSQDSSHIVPGIYAHNKTVMINGSPDTSILTKKSSKGKITYNDKCQFRHEHS